MGLSVREITPEILDDLPADDPRAVRSRRDLRRVNAIMLQDRIMARLMRRHVEAPPRRILEIGAGDGAFSLAVARRLARAWPGAEIVLLDRQDIVAPATRDEFAGLGWTVRTVTEDVFAFLARPDARDFDVVAANLFLHHFDAPSLRDLFRRAAAVAPVLVATEPFRGPLPHSLSRLLWAIGANDVTRHDATVSVRAGFAGRELSDLWPDEGGWRLEERRAGPFTHTFAASRGTEPGA